MLETKTWGKATSKQLEKNGNFSWSEISRYILAKNQKIHLLYIVSWPWPFWAFQVTSNCTGLPCTRIPPSTNELRWTKMSSPPAFLDSHTRNVISPIFRFIIPSVSTFPMDYYCLQIAVMKMELLQLEI